MRTRTILTALLGLAAAAAVLVPATNAAAGTSKRVSAWLPYWDETALDDFIAHRDLYDEVLPFWFEMRPGGVVHAYPGAGAREVVDAARAGNVAIIPTINNDFDPIRLRDMLATTASTDAHIARLVDVAAPYDGLDVDYEGGYGSDRARFTTFTRRLASALHARGKTLSMTLHPKTSEPGTWDGAQSQDWAAIGAVADRVRIMAYDAHWATSSAGGVAPKSWVRSVVQFGVSQIPAAKLKLGMPLYGYDWVGQQGVGVTWKTAESIRSSRSASLRRSSDGSEPWFTYTAGGETHTVWYSDRASTAAKLGLVDEFGLSGLTFWRLGGEDPSVWDAVRAWAQPTVAKADAGDNVAPTKVRTSVSQWYRSASVRWTKATDASAVRYQVWRAASRTGRLWRIAVISDATSMRDRNLRGGQAYWYAVRAIDAAGNVGPMSARVTG